MCHYCHTLGYNYAVKAHRSINCMDVYNTHSKNKYRFCPICNFIITLDLNFGLGIPTWFCNRCHFNLPYNGIYNIKNF